MIVGSKRHLITWLRMVAQEAGELLEQSDSAIERERLREVERAALRAIEMVAKEAA